ncbi:MAG: hypothetical protein AAGD04_11785 [Pseudomonadota bacterium]
MLRTFISAAGIIGLTMTPLSAQNRSFLGIGAITNFVPNRVEAITDYYTAENGSLVRNAHTVGQSPCSSTWIAPYVMITAAHCGDNAFRGFWMEAYRDRIMLNYPATISRTPCQRFLASGFHSSSADFALWDCRPDALRDAPTDRLTSAREYPGGVQYGYAIPDRAPVREGQKVYSVWRNPVTNDPVLSNQGRSTLYSEGEVTKLGVLNRWAGPNYVNCSKEPNANGVENSLDGQAVETNLFSAPGASGSLQFSQSSHRVVIGPLATGNSSLRTAMTMRGTFGQGLPEGDRMIVETYLERGRAVPDRVPTLLRYQEKGTGKDIDVLTNCKDITQMSNLALTDRNNDMVYDVVAETMAWNWRQPHHFFSFTDPLTAARWELLRNGEPVTGIVPINRAIKTPVNGRSNDQQMRYTPPEVTGERHMVFTKVDHLQIKPEMNNVERGDYRVTVEAAVSTSDPSGGGAFNLRAVCPGTSDSLVSFSIPKNPRPFNFRLLMGQDIKIACDKPRLAFEGVDGTPALLIRSISIIKTARSLNFAAIDERDMWTGSKAQHALFTADGDFREFERPGRSYFGLNVPAGSSASLKGYALEPGKTYEVSFRARSILGETARLAYGPVNRGMGIATVTPDWRNFNVTLRVPETTAANPALTFHRSGGSDGVTIIDHLTIRPE